MLGAVGRNKLKQVGHYGNRLSWHADLGAIATTIRTATSARRAKMTLAE
jgi:hypothetical protein